MALVTGPLHSDAASGSIKGGVTFSRWKGRAYVRQTVTPLNPQSAKQTGVRCMMRFLARLWSGLSSASQATWDSMAASKQISAFNAFVSENLMRWQSFLSPTTDFPAAEVSTGLTVSTQTLTGGQGMVTIDMTPSGSTDILGFAIFRDTAEITSPNWNNCIAVGIADGANLVSYVDSPLDAGTYHYRTAVINVDGVMGTVHADGTATAS